MQAFNQSKYEIAFMDGVAPDLSDLAGLIPDHVQLLTIGAGQDPIIFIAEALQARGGAEAIHLLGHGEPGSITLGGMRINASVLTHYVDILNVIGALLDGGEILVYGCETGRGDTGTTFVQALSKLTGVGVVAAEAPVGHASLGGGWALTVGTASARALELTAFEGTLGGILQNRYVRFGYGDQGTLGSGGNTSPGIQYDPDGNRKFLASADSLTPGTPFEGFTVKVGGRQFYENNSQWNDQNLGTSVTARELTTSGSDTYGSVSFVTNVGGLRIEQTYTLAGVDAKVITMSVTVTNPGDTAVYDVSYARYTDPDVDSNGLPGSTSSTNNQRGADGIAASDIVLATGPVSGRVIGLYSNSSFQHDTAVSRGWSQDTAAYLGGGNDGPRSDAVIGIGFNLGDFAAGASKTFSFAYVFAANAAALEESVAEVPPSNAAPVLNAIDAVDSVLEDTLVEITFADIIANSNAADSDGTVDAFVVGAVTSGTLLIGTSLETATAWAAGTNDQISATLNAYWTPAADANGRIDAFAITAVDDKGAVSGAAVQVPVNVDAVNDSPVLLVPSVSIRPVREDQTDHPGQTVAALISPVVADPDADGTPAGIAISADASTPAQGGWQYSTDSGATWITLPEVSEDSALMLDAAAKLRFVPAADYNGAVPALTVRAVDASYVGGFSGAGGVLLGDLTDVADGGAISTGSTQIGGTVIAVNDAPRFTSVVEPVTLSETAAADASTGDLGLSGTLSGVVSATDVERDSFAFSIRGGILVDGVWTVEGRFGTLTLDAETDTWTYSPSHWTAINALIEGELANDSFDIRVTDERGGVAVQTITVNLTGANDDPILSAAIADQSFTGEGFWTYQIPAATFHDAEGTSLTYAATLADGAPLPEWLGFDAASRTFSGNPPVGWNDEGLTIRVTATDAEGASVSDEFALSLSGTGDQPPVLTNPLVWTSVLAPVEETSVTFGPMLGGQTITFDGASITLGETVAAAEVSAAVAAATLAGYVADPEAAAGTVVLVADADGARSDFALGDVIDFSGGTGTVTRVVEGRDGAAQVDDVQFAFDPVITSVTFDGVVIDLSSALDASDVAALIVAAVTGESANWTAEVSADMPDTVRFTARASDDRAALTAADFEPDVAAPGPATSAVQIVDGQSPATETVEIAFTGALGGAVIDLGPVGSITVGAGVTPEQIADAIKAQSDGLGFANYDIVSTEGGTVVIRASEGGARPDLTAADFIVTSPGDAVGAANGATVDVTTQGAGWSQTLPTDMFTDPEGGVLTYEAFVITTDPETGVQTATAIGTSDPALGFDAATMTLSGDGIAPSNGVIEIRATDAAGNVAASQFQFVLRNGAVEPSLVATGGPLDAVFTEGAGAGKYVLPAGAFEYIAAGGTLGFSATLADGSALPDWLDFDGVTGTFRGNPPAGSTDLALIVTATNGTLSDSQALTLRIEGQPDDPLVLVGEGLADQPAATVGEGGAVSIVFAAPFADPDAAPGDTIAYDAFVQMGDARVPASSLGLTLTETTPGQFTLSGSVAAEASSLNIIVQGTATSGATAETSFTLNLNNAATSGPDRGAWSANSTGAVSITGDAIEGGTLSAVVAADGDGFDPAGVVYQWQVERDGVWMDIAGATADSFTLTNDQSGHQVRAQVFYVDDAGAAELPVSDAVSIANVNQTGALSINPGTPTVGSVWTTTLADGDGLFGSSPTYMWMRADTAGGIGTVIDGAVYGTYRLTEADSGKFLSVVAFYTDDQGTVSEAASAKREVSLSATAPVAGDDIASVIEAAGAVGGTSPLTGSLLTNDTDANEGDLFAVTSLRQGDREGAGNPAVLVGDTLTVTGLYGTLTVDLTTGDYNYVLDETNPSVNGLNAGSEPLRDVFNYTITDSALLSDSALLTIEVNGANDLPVLTGIAETAPATEDVLTRLDVLDVATIADADSGALSLTLSVDSGTLSLLGDAAASGITVAGNNTGTLTLSGVSATALRGWLLDNGVGYLTAANATDGAILRYALRDEAGIAATGETVIEVTPVNDAPLVDAGGTPDQTLGFASEDLRFVPTGTAQVLNFDGTSIAVGAGSTAQAIAEAFAAQSFNNWTVEDLGNGTVRLIAKVPGDRAHLTASDFVNGASNPSPLVLTEGGDDNAVRFTARGNAILIAPELEISDVDGGTLTSATVEMSAGVFDNQFGTIFETLSLNADAQAAAEAAGLAVTITGNAGGASITITGTAAIAVYETILRGVSYQNSNPNAYVGEREAVIRVSDGGAISNAASLALTEANGDVAVGQRVFVGGVDTGVIVAEVIDGKTFVTSRPIEGLANGASISFHDANGAVTGGTAQIDGGATVAIGVVWAPYIDLNGPAAVGTGIARAYVEQAPSIAVAAANASILDQDGLTKTLGFTLTNPLDNVEGGAPVEYLTVTASVLATLAARGITLLSTDGEIIGGALVGATSLTFVAASGASSSNFQIALRGVRYVNGDDAPDTTPRSITVQAIDTDGNVGIPTTAIVNVTPVNDAPVGIDVAVLGTEDTDLVLGLDAFGFSDPVDGGAHALASVTIAALPQVGTLLLDSVPVEPGQTVSRADLEAGHLVYRGPENAQGERVASIAFNVRDDGGTANGGTDFDASPATLTIDLSAENDAPVIVEGDTTAATITEDDVANPGQLVADLLGGFTDADTGTHSAQNGTLSGMAITGMAGSGQWQFSLNGAIWSDIVLDAGKALLLTSADLVRFVPDARNATTATLDYHVWDQATGVRGSVAVPSGTAFSEGTGRVTLDVTAVNDAPVVEATGGVFFARGAAASVFEGDGPMLGDVDDGDILTGATLVMDGATTQDNDFGTIYETITGAARFTAASGTVLTITGNGTADAPIVIAGEGSLADYREALSALRYENTNPNAAAGERTLTLTVTDGAGQASAPHSFGFAVTWGTVADLNGAGVEGRDHVVAFTENGGSVAIAASDAELVDQSGNTASVVVTLADAVNGAAERLYIDPAQLGAFARLGVTVIGNGSHEIVLGTGVGGLDPTFFQLALRSIRYSNSSDAPTDAARHVTVSSTDSDGNPGVSATTVIGVTKINDAPVSTLAVENATDADRGAANPRAGDVLQIVGDVSDADGIAGARTVEWLRAGVVVGTGATYALTRADAGTQITARVSFTDAEGTAEEARTAPTGTVADLVVLNGTEGADLLIDGSGVDAIISGFGSNDTLGGGAGNDTLLGGGGSDTADYASATGGVSVDLGLTGSQIIGGGEGTDVLDSIENLAGGTHDDLLTGDTGANMLTGRVGADVLLGGGGNDSLYGNHGTDLLSGEAGDDWLHGGQDNDVLYGGAGNDTLAGGKGDDFIDGGTGTDTVDYATAEDGVTANLSLLGPQAISMSEGTDTLISIENVFGGRHNDILTGDSRQNILVGGEGSDLLSGLAGSDTLAGGIGNDSLYGNQGTDLLSGEAGDDWLHGGQDNDVLYGGAGNDTLAGGKGDDFIDGGTGTDTVDYATAEDGITASLSLLIAQIISASEGIDTLVSIENLFGGRHDDTLTGNAQQNVLRGGDGSDLLTGLGGNDMLDGGTGNDRLYGNQGDDSLRGGAGDDWLHGGQGNDLVDGGADNDYVAGGKGDDLLIGGAGADTFVFEYVDGSGGVDVIVDFIKGEDRIGLSSSLSGLVDKLNWDAASSTLSLEIAAETRLDLAYIEHDGDLVLTRDDFLFV